MTEGCQVPKVERYEMPKLTKLRWLNAIFSYLSFLHSTILCLPSVFLDASSHFYKWACMSVGNQFFFISLKFGTRVRQGKKNCMRRWRKILRPDFDCKRFNCENTLAIARFYPACTRTCADIPLTRQNHLCTRACAELPRTRQNHLVGRIFDPTGSCY